MPTPSHDNDDTRDDDFDFLSEESQGGRAPEPNADKLDSLLDQTLNVKPAAKLPIIRKPVPVSESGPNMSPSERAANGSNQPARAAVSAPTSAEFEDNFDFLDDTSAHPAKAAPASDFAEAWNDGLHDYDDDYDESRSSRKPLWLALAGLGALVLGGFLAFQSEIFKSDNQTVSVDQGVSDSILSPNNSSAGEADSSNNLNGGVSIAEQFKSNLARIEGLVANGEFENAEAAIDALDPRVLGYGQPEFSALSAQIQAGDTGVGTNAEAQRLADALIAEEAQQAEDARRVEDARIAAEAQRAAEEARIATEAQRAEEEARIAAEAQRAAEEARIATEAQRAEEEARIAAEAQRAAEEARIAAEAQRAAEETRIAAEAQRAAEESRIAAEAQRVAEEARIAAEAQRAAEEARIAAEAIRLEEQRLAEEAQRLAEAQQAQLAQQQARAEQAARVAADADRLERQQLEEIAAQQRADARQGAVQRAAPSTGGAPAPQPSTSDREATDRLAAVATTNTGLEVINRGISDAEASQIDRRLQAVKEAIRARNMGRLTELTAVDRTKVQTFFQLFTNSQRIDVRVDGSRAQASVGVVVGTLQINRIISNDGTERAVPESLRSFTLTTRREGEQWSKFSW